MTAQSRQCKICLAYYRLTDGRLPPHPNLRTGNPCRGRIPRASNISEYTVGWDHHPAEVSAGQWESNRVKH